MSKFKNKLVSFVKGETMFSGAMTALFISLVIVANVIIFVLTSHFGLYIFTEEREDLSLSGYTDELFADAIGRGEKVKIIFCQSDEDILANSNGSRVIATAKNYEERYPEFIEVEYLNIITKRNSKGEYVDTSKYVKEGTNGAKSPLLASSVIFESKYDHRVLTDSYSSTGYAGFYTVSSSGYPVAYNGEEVMAAMIMWTLAREHESVYFTTFHGEIADVGFSNMLVCAGFDVHTIDLKKSEIPDDAAMIVISNPQKDFERAAEGSGMRTEIERLRGYVELGGRIFVTFDPYVKSLPVLEDFLTSYGISISTSEHDNGSLRNIVRDSDNAITSDFFTFAAKPSESGLGTIVNDTVLKYTDASSIVKTSAALELSGGAEPLLLSSAASTLYSAGKEVDREGSYCIAAANVFETENGEQGAVVVIPSVFIIATDALVTDGYANRTFLYSVFDNLFGAEVIPYGCRTVYFANQILENLNMKTARIYTAVALAIPVAIAIVGGVVIVRRKNR